MNESRTPDTVVLIHGSYLSWSSWEGWKSRFESRGFKVLAPGWPGMEGTVEELRRDPAPIASQRVETILDHYERIIRSLDRPPIIMGHSFGGTFLQVLLSRGLGAAGVGIAAGTRSRGDGSAACDAQVELAPVAQPARPQESDHGYGFTNTFTEQAAQSAYERYAVPGARNVLFSVPYSQFRASTPLKADWNTRPIGRRCYSSREARITSCRHP